MGLSARTNLPIIEESALEKEQEISQENNPNACSRLWIQRDGTVFKRFDTTVKLSRKNLYNIKKLSSIDALQESSSIALATAFVKNSGELVGYCMPHIEGQTLDSLLRNSEASPNQKLNALCRLAKIIVDLPPNVFIGDLHAHNVIVSSSGAVSLIDTDGFSLRSKYRLTCPIRDAVMNSSSLRQRKYRFPNGSFRISRNTDILCFFVILMRFIMGGIDFLTYTADEVFRYLDYLEMAGFPQKLADMIRLLYKRQQNMLDPKAVEFIDAAKLDSFEYEALRRGIHEQRFDSIRAFQPRNKKNRRQRFLRLYKP